MFRFASKIFYNLPGDVITSMEKLHACNLYFIVLGTVRCHEAVGLFNNDASAESNRSGLVTEQQVFERLYFCCAFHSTDPQSNFLCHCVLMLGYYSSAMSVFIPDATI